MLRSCSGVYTFKVRGSLSRDATAGEMSSRLRSGDEAAAPLLAASTAADAAARPFRRLLSFDDDAASSSSASSPPLLSLTPPRSDGEPFFFFPPAALLLLLPLGLAFSSFAPPSSPSSSSTSASRSATCCKWKTKTNGHEGASFYFVHPHTNITFAHFLTAKRTCAMAVAYSTLSSSSLLRQWAPFFFRACNAKDRERANHK